MEAACAEHDGKSIDGGGPVAGTEGLRGECRGGVDEAQRVEGPDAWGRKSSSLPFLPFPLNASADKRQYSPRHPNLNKAIANWEKKSAYLLREIVKFRTYIDALNLAGEEKTKIDKERAERAEEKEERDRKKREREDAAVKLAGLAAAAEAEADGDGERAQGGGSLEGTPRVKSVPYDDEGEVTPQAEVRVLG